MTSAPSGPLSNPLSNSLSNLGRPSYFIGCITGTSVDGLDLALLRLHAQARGAEIETCAYATVDIPTDLRQELLALGQPGSNEIDRLGAADATLGRFIAEQINRFLATHQITSDQVTAIGSHGQTVRHRPPAFTLQIGDPNQIAEHTGITTVADFRRRDMAAGGEGAPLVPLFHQALLGNSNQAQALLNVGGLANLTGIPTSGQALVGFDTGPGNGLMDAWIMRHQQQAYDADGQWAAQGNVNQRLLTQLLADPYFARKPPKSTGKEYFNLAWLETQLALTSAIVPQDVQATLLELTATSVAQAIAALHQQQDPQQPQGYDRVLVCGGGRLNGQLMQRLGAVLAEQSIALSTTESIGVDGDSLEAAAFAWLACQTLAGLPGSDASVTGAKGPRVLGAIYPGSN